MPPKLHATQRPSLVSFGVKTVLAASISALLCTTAYAAGLGKLTVLSSLGQPLLAEIELTSVARDDAQGIGVKLAPVEAFRQANIELNPALFSLRFAIEKSGSRQFIRVTSTQPINEPFVDMLLELSAENSRLVREYTFLLDPADLRRTQPVQIAAPTAPKGVETVRSAPVAQASSVPTQRSQASASPAARPAARASAPAPALAEAPSVQDDYRVKNGDTLAGIARQNKPQGVSLDQMLIAFQRANPSAFSGKNINRLRSGEILRIPDAATAQAVDASEAKRTVLAQAADFNSYRSKLAGQVGAADAQQSNETGQSAGGKITAKIDEQSTPAGAALDKLQLSKAGAASAAGAGGVAAGSAAADSVSKDKALAEANARVLELENNLRDLQQLLEIKNKNLAPAPTTGESANVAPATTDGVAPNVAAPAVDASGETAEQDAAAGTSPDNTPAITPPVAEQVKAPTDQAAAPKAVVAEPVPEPSFLQGLLENPLLLGVLAALLAALAGLGIYGRRKKQHDLFQDSSILTDSSLKTNSLFGSTGGQSVDTSNSVFNSNFSPSASQLDTNEVDPVAEADVYIAYGRDAQAEEILKEALRTQPERNAVRVKLLEIYANRKDVRSFEIMASELYSLTKGEGEDWQQAAGLGVMLDPKNPLYAGGTPTDNSASIDAMTASTEQIEELDLAALLNTTTQSSGQIAEPDDVKLAATPFFDEAALGASAASATLAAPDFHPAALPAVEDTPTTAAEDPATPAALDFDFNLDDFRPKMAEQTPVVTSVQDDAVTEPAVTTNTIDFDFLQESDIAADLAADKGDLSFESEPGAFDLGTGGSLASAEAVPAPAAVDLSDISLDLDPAGVDAINTSDANFNATEMATKLDLALAYQEIGDKDGARELLDEVVIAGSKEQIEKAKELIQKIA